MTGILMALAIAPGAAIAIFIYKISPFRNEGVVAVTKNHLKNSDG
jgi:hypothetical protein